LDKRIILPTISAAGGFRTGGAITTKQLSKVYGEELAKKMITNGLKTNPVLFEFMMGWPLNWTSLKPLKKIIIPKWNLHNLKKIKPRKKVKNQKARIHAIGNGQVPLCVYAILKLYLKE